MIDKEWYKIRIKTAVSIRNNGGSCEGVQKCSRCFLRQYNGGTCRADLIRAKLKQPPDTRTIKYNEAIRYLKEISEEKLLEALI